MSKAFRYLETLQFECAKDVCLRGLEVSQNNADLWHILGLALYQTRCLDESIQALARACELQPENAAQHNNLGMALFDHGEYRAAQASYKVALQLNPQFPEVNNNLGNALQKTGDLDGAEEYLKTALELRPHYPEALNNLGLVMHVRKQYQAAMELFESALEKNPNYVSALNNLAAVCIDQLDAQRALQSSLQAIEIQSDSAEAHLHIGLAHDLLGNRSEALLNLKKAMLLDLNLGPNYLFKLSNADDLEAEFVFDEHVWWAQHFSEGIPRLTADDIDKNSERTIRIGYVSPDFRHHVVAHYIEPVLENHSDEVDVYCYAEVSAPDAVTQRLQQKVANWRSTCGKSDDQVANEIQQDQIDILIDLAGHTKNNRLGVFARKPAPVQATWIGYPNTTGLEAIDYRITTEFQDPKSERHLHVEKLIYLPSTSTTYQPPQDAPEIVEPPCLENGFLTFGSLHRIEKISETTIALWANVLNAIPDSRLLIYWPTLTKTMMENFSKQFVESEVDLTRIDFRNGTSANSYLNVYNSIDIGLDVFPWTGGTTTREALWMGVPVVALYGDRRSARGSAEVLHQLELDEFVADTFDRYVEIAKQITPSRLNQLRPILRRQMSLKLADAKAFTNSFETILREMWRRQCQSGTSSSSSIPGVGGHLAVNVID